MTRTRWTLWYPVGYLIPSGLMLALAPRIALKILFSNGDYGDVMPRLVGVLCIGLGVIVVQVIRHQAEVLYPTVIGVRAFFLPCWLALYAWSRDPMFLSLFAVVGLGFVLSAVTYQRER